MPIDVEKLAREAGGVNMLCDGFDNAATVFEPAQLHRFAALVLEAAAVQCARISEDRWSAYKNRPPYEGNEVTRYNQHTEGESDGADLCEAAIRAMKPGESHE